MKTKTKHKVGDKVWVIRLETLERMCPECADETVIGGCNMCDSDAFIQMKQLVIRECTVTQAGLPGDCLSVECKNHVSVRWNYFHESKVYKKMEEAQARLGVLNGRLS